MGLQRGDVPLACLVRQVIDQSVSDVDPFEDTLEVPDMIQEATVKHLHDQLEQLEHFLLGGAETKFARDFI